MKFKYKKISMPAKKTHFEIFNYEPRTNPNEYFATKFCIHCRKNIFLGKAVTQKLYGHICQFRHVMTS